jgi:redox-sensitive bicupin YhaK (pirin superfamily)
MYRPAPFESAARWFAAASSRFSDRASVGGEGSEAARLIVVAGRSLREPIAKYGPFIMNTEAELRQAVADYRTGRF